MRVQQLSEKRFIRERGRKLAIETCYLDKDSIRDCGEGVGIIVRRHTGGKHSVASFLIDAWCRGIYDCFYATRLEDDEYEHFLDRMLHGPAQHPEEVPYEELHNWVFGAVEFAAEAGIEPHEDFAVCKYLLEDDEDERIPIIQYPFGVDGKHHLVSSDPAELSYYIPIMREHLGEGNFSWGVNPFGAPFAGQDDAEVEPEYFKESDAVCRLTLRIELAHVKPLVWRKVEVPSNMTLRAFHDVIQCVMDWYDLHLHAFRKGIDDIDETEEDRLTLGDFLRNKGDWIAYEYDFGDGWVHRISVLKDPVPSEDLSIRILGGKNAAPPEDCGGPWIYSDYLALRAAGDKKRLRMEIPDWKERFGPDRDPAYFDLEEIQYALDDCFGQE